MPESCKCDDREFRVVIMKEQLRITLVTDPNSWLRPHLVELSELLIQMGHNVSIVYSAEDIYCGDIAFFLSFQEIVSSKFLRLNFS